MNFPRQKPQRVQLQLCLVIALYYTPSILIYLVKFGE